MSAQVILTLANGTQAGKTFVFDRPTKCIIGRADDCAVQLPSIIENRNVSRHHCLLDIDPPAVRIHDLESLNGTFVNGVKIGQRVRGAQPGDQTAAEVTGFDLQDGDEIRLGHVILQLGVTQPAYCDRCASPIPGTELEVAEKGPGVYVCSWCREEDEVPVREPAGCGDRSEEVEALS
jgi:eukaryotic-like serine/threonine-protein kinase